MNLDFDVVLKFYNEKVAQLEHELIMQKAINQQLQNELDKLNIKEEDEC